MAAAAAAAGWGRGKLTFARVLGSARNGGRVAINGRGLTGQAFCSFLQAHAAMPNAARPTKDVTYVPKKTKMFLFSGDFLFFFIYLLLILLKKQSSRVRIIGFRISIPGTEGCVC